MARNHGMLQTRPQAPGQHPPAPVRLGVTRTATVLQHAPFNSSLHGGPSPRRVSAHRYGCPHPRAAASRVRGSAHGRRADQQQMELARLGCGWPGPWRCGTAGRAGLATWGTSSESLANLNPGFTSPRGPRGRWPGPVDLDDAAPDCCRLTRRARSAARCALLPSASAAGADGAGKVPEAKGGAAAATPAGRRPRTYQLGLRRPSCRPGKRPWCGGRVSAQAKRRGRWRTGSRGDDAQAGNPQARRVSGRRCGCRRRGAILFRAPAALRRGYVSQPGEKNGFNRLDKSCCEERVDAVELAYCGFVTQCCSK
jgi:hypothetical protein